MFQYFLLGALAGLYLTSRVLAWLIIIHHLRANNESVTSLKDTIKSFIDYLDDDDDDDDDDDFDLTNTPRMPPSLRN
jgi:hypothetical protein